MNLASFKESGELEYGADDAFILTASSATDRLLSQHKARYGETGAIKLAFNGAVQQFEAIEATSQGNADGSLLSTLQDLWDSTPSAGGRIWQP
jgi:replicative DNA helicase